MAMPNAAVAPPPILREGDRMDSAEFLRRWEAMPDLKHAELLTGVVFFMASPTSRIHGNLHGRLSGWLSHYADSTPGCEIGAETTWVLSKDSAPQPDLSLRILPERGGQSGNAGEYCEGAPELIVEVSGSTLSRDLGIKLDMYRQAGVREYVTVLLQPRQIVWRELVRGRYREIVPDEDGLLRSRIFPGLWLDPEAIWDSRKPLPKAVEAGVQTPEHAAFVQRLAKPRKK